MDKTITREIIDKTILEVSENFSLAPRDSLMEAIDKMSQEQLDNPLMMYSTVLAVAQSNSMLMLKEILYRLFEV